MSILAKLPMLVDRRLYVLVESLTESIEELPVWK